MSFNKKATHQKSFNEKGSSSKVIQQNRQLTNSYSTRKATIQKSFNKKATQLKDI